MNGEHKAQRRLKPMMKPIKRAAKKTARTRWTARGGV